MMAPQLAVRVSLAVLLAATCFVKPGTGLANTLSTTLGSSFDILHRWSFFDVPRTQTAALKDGWAAANTTREFAMQLHPAVWCRNRDYRVCLLFDDAGSVAGLKFRAVGKRLASITQVSVVDFEKSVGSLYPIDLETQWKRHTLLDVDVYSATALFVPPKVLSEGGRACLSDQDGTVPETLFLENGNGYWAVPTDAESAGDVAYTKQGCVKGAGRHYFYDMSPKMACDEHRPFFLLYDDVTGVLHGFGVTLFGKSSKLNLLNRNWLEEMGDNLIKAMTPDAPECFRELAKEKGLVSLHVYFTPKPWKLECA